jgi:tRNA threonylcarbamoyladenosine modification (KEOPS) complex  Pcc1 subunit
LRQGHTTLTLKSCKAKIRLSSDGKRAVNSIRAALTPDLSRLPKEEVRAFISLENSDIFFRIETDDIASLRASINSYLRLADASYRCIT